MTMPHSLDLNPTYEIFIDVEMYLGGIGRVVYSDNTEQFVDDFGNEYSPRLSEKDLAEFCTENIGMYESFHSENISSIVRMITTKMKPFW